jgi:hypothetical protein
MLLLVVLAQPPCRWRRVTPGGGQPEILATTTIFATWRRGGR